MLTQEQLFILREEIDRKGHILDMPFPEWITSAYLKIEEIMSSDTTSDDIYNMLHQFIKFSNHGQLFDVNDIRQYTQYSLNQYGINKNSVLKLSEMTNDAKYAEEIFKAYKKDKFRNNVSGWQKPVGVSIFIILLFIVGLLCL